MGAPSPAPAKAPGGADIGASARGGADASSLLEELAMAQRLRMRTR